MTHRRFPFSRALLLASVAIVAGCTAGPDYKQPDKPKEQGYTPESLSPQTVSAPIEGGATQTFVEGRDIPGDWWTLFGSEELTSLVREALSANPDIDAAQATLRQANETLYAQQGSLFPSLTANGSGTQQQTTGAALGSSSVGQVQYGVVSASLAVAYSPDIFGGVRRQVESQAAQVDVQRFALEATYLTLSSNVVVAAVNLASLRAQIAATEQVIKLQSDAIGLVQTQVDLGGASQADLLAQQANLRATQATLPPLQKQLAIQRNQLMTLLGKPPTFDAGQGLQLASFRLPEQVPLSLPSQLVEQRPDVRSAEAQLQVASANIGVAVAAQLPQFNITAGIGYTAAGIATLFSPASLVWNLGLAVAQPLFNGGKLDHQRKAAEAAYDAAAAKYRSTVLSAFQDVANALRSMQADADLLRASVASEQTAAASLAIVQQQYQLGSVNYLALLNAQTTYQNAILGRVRAQAQRFSDTAAMIQALGGGWWNRTDVRPESKGKPGVFNLPPVDQIHLPRAGH